MTQRSAIFVVYRCIQMGRYEYYARLDSSGPTVRYDPNGGKISTDLAHAIQLDRAMAFREAIRRGQGWAAGELVSTKAGIKVAE